MPITRMGVAWGGLMQAVVDTIDEWQPGDLSRELAYRDSLAAFIRKSSPDARVEKEYRHQGTTIDLAVMWKGLLSDGCVFIELKLNLTKKGEFDRLIGQIESISRSNRLVLVLCGKTDPAFLDRLQERYSDFLDPFIPIADNPMVIRLKPHAKAKAKGAK